jgi:hypothetical protein
MSLTITVPAAVPSLFQSSLPPTPSEAGMNKVPATSVMVRRMLKECTWTVPAAVPSVFIKELFNLVKKRVLPMRIKAVGFESPVPGTMSLSRAVPPGVPSLFHSSIPFAGSCAAK